MEEEKAARPVEGMEVFSADGALLGVIDRVWSPAEVAEPAPGPLEQGMPGHPEPGKPSDRWQPIETGYLRLDRGSPGPDRYLYVPLTAIRGVDPLEARVDLAVPFDQVELQGWTIRPHFLPESA